MSPPAVWKPHKTFKGHTGAVMGVIHLPEGKQMITCSTDGSLRLWNLENGSQIGKDWRDPGNSVLQITLSPDGRRVASGGDDGAVKLWDITSGKIVSKCTGHGASESVASIFWSRDGQRVLSSSKRGALRLWNVKSGESTQLRPPSTTAIYNTYACPVTYSPDETMVAAVGGGKDAKKIKIWDAKTFKLVATLEFEEPRETVWCLAWTMDGKTLISGSSNGSIRKWNAASWKQSGVFARRHSQNVCAIAISPNGRVLASASNDNTARLWNLQDGQLIGSPLHHRRTVYCVSFSADGRLLATGSHDFNAYAWDVSTILKEAGFDDLLLDSDALQQIAGKSVLNADTTQRPVRPSNNKRMLPQGFFDDEGGSIHPPSTQLPSPQHSLSRPRAPFDRISSLFRRSHLVRNTISHVTPTPFRLLEPTLPHVVRRHHSDSDRRESIVEVPCTRGDPRNVHAVRQQAKSPHDPKNVMVLTIPGTSRLQMSGDMQQSNQPIQSLQSSQTENLLIATHTHAITTTGTPSSPDAVIRQSGGWTRLLCCISPEGTANLE